MSLPRTLLRLRTAALARRSVSPAVTLSPRARFYADQPSASDEVKEFMRSEPVRKFQEDPEVVETTQRLQAYLLSKDTADNPPGSVALLRLMASSDFRDILSSMQKLATKHNVDANAIARLGELTKNSDGGGSP